MSNTMKTIDEILNHLQTEAFDDAGLADASIAELKQALSTMVVEIIGEYDNVTSDEYPAYTRGEIRDDLRAEQRQSLADRGFTL